MNAEALIAWRPARFWRADGERIVCTLCPFRCALADGALGLCQVRRRRGPGLETATFASAVRHLHPVERKPLYHFRPGTLALTLAAPGCTFRCDYCQNSRLSQYGRDEDAPWRANPVDAADLAAEAKALGAMLALSYTEPTLAAELTLALAEEARAAGVELVWKSNGFITPEALDLIAPRLAAVNVDLKAADESAHRQLTGAPLAPVLEALAGYKARGVWLEVSTPLIPGFNSDADSLLRLAEAVCALGPDTPWHLLRFHPDYRRLDAGPTAPGLLEQAVAIGKAAGLRYLYVERALGERGRNTYCPSCGALAVSRTLWALDNCKLVDGACPACREPIAGIW